MRLLLLTLLILMSSLPLNSAKACGPDSDCVLENNRHYRLKMPDGYDGVSKIGAIIYAHGYKGSAAGAMRNKSLTKAVSELGLALISVKSYGDDWSIPNSPAEPKPEELVELDYFDAVIADATTRFPIDKDLLMMTGFSAGGMMTWTLACERAEKFIGFAPISGTFWEPIPTSCPSAPANVIHTHGTSDRVVPLEGRPIRRTHQGNLANVLNMYARNGHYTAFKKDYKVLDLTCSRSQNPDGKILEICLHPGGHEFKTQYITRAWKEFQALQSKS